MIKAAYNTILWFCMMLITLKGFGQGPCDLRLMTDSAEILFDGPVNKFTRDGHLMYAGGRFSTVGRFTGSFVGLDPLSGRADNLAAWPKVRGTTRGAIIDGSGNLIIYGSFVRVGDSMRSSIAIINSSGVVTTFKATINGSVNTAVINNGILHIGGDFTSVNGQTRNRLAAINLSTATLTAWDPDIRNSGAFPCYVECMTAHNGILYFGGSFSQVAASARKNIAAVNLTSGAVTGWAPEAYFSTVPNYGSIKSMYRVNNLIYVSGQFDYIGGGSHGDIAALEITTGLSNAWVPNPNSAVYSFTHSGDTLYIGGAFSLISGHARQGFAAYSASTGNLLPLVINTSRKHSDIINTIAVSGNTIYLGGIFDSIGGQFRKNIASFNRFTATPHAFVNQINDDVNNMILHNGRLYIGGNFFSVNMKERRSLAQLDLDADSVINWRNDVDGEVHSLTVNKKRLYIGGHFTKIKDSVRTNAAALDITTQKVLNWNPKPDNIVSDIVCYKDQTFLAGQFKLVSGQTRNAIAKVDTAGNLQAWVGITDTGAVVNCMKVHNDSLYVGGRFNDLGGQPRRCLGTIDLTTGFATGWNPGSHVSITAMYIMGDTLFVAGLYPTVMPTPPPPPLLPPPPPIIADVDRFLSYRLSNRTLINWDKALHADGPIHDMIVTRPDFRAYVIGDFSIITVNGFPELGLSANLSRFGILGLPMVPPPGPQDPFPKPMLFNKNFLGIRLNTICMYGNKLYCGGQISDLYTGYHNAALFTIPYHILEAGIETDTNGLCAGKQATIRAKSSVTYGATYQWNVNGVNIVNPLSHYTFAPQNKDSVYCTVSVPGNGCVPAWQDTTNSIVYNVTPTVNPDISITSVIEEENGTAVTVKAIVKNAATGYTIEWFNKGVSIATTTGDTISYVKGPGTDSIYAIITPRKDTCYVTDTSGLITVNEKPVGISSLHGDAKIQVYPNPFERYVSIKGLEEGDLLIVYDVTGRKILSAINSNANYYTLSTGNLSSGTYVLKITDRHGGIRKSFLMQKR